MTELLQKLLNDRDEVLLLYEKWLFCSCGQKFDDYSEAENHLVLKHQRRQQQRNNIRDLPRAPEVLCTCNENTIGSQNHRHGQNQKSSNQISSDRIGKDCWPSYLTHFLSLAIHLGLRTHNFQPSVAETIRKNPTSKIIAVSMQ